MSEKKASVLNRIIMILSIGMCLFECYTAATLPLQVSAQRGLFVAFAFLIFFLSWASETKNVVLRIGQYLLGIVSVCAALYVVFEWEDMMGRTIKPLTTDYIAGLVTIVLVLIISIKTLGIWMPLIAGVFILYAYIGPMLPGVLYFKAINLRRFITSVFFGTEGIYGSVLGVAATFVFMFILFGETLLHFGAGDFILELSQCALGRVRGGPAKIAVLASSLFGAVSGSAVANVATTGCLTIPLMKRSGYQPEYAGGVESTASTGGQLMPPVMGSAAFIMSEMIGVAYGALCVFAIIPALLYYVAVFLMVDLRAAKLGLKGMSKEELPDFVLVMKKGWHFLFSLATLIILLVILQWSASKAAFWACIVLIVADWGKKLFTKEKIDFSTLLKVCEGTAKGSFSVAASTACAGIIMGIFTATGLNLRFSTLLIELAGESLLALLVLAAVGAIILGMGIPTTPVYILMSVLAAPALVDMGVPLLSAHMFVFYFGVLAPITPPVGLAFYVASGIAKSSPMKTGFAAWKLAISGFILPFIFVYEPGILLQGTVPEILWAVATCVVGIAALSFGIEGYCFTDMSVVLRVVVIVAALMTILPETYTSYIGFALLAICVIYQFAIARKRKAAASA